MPIPSFDNYPLGTNRGRTIIYLPRTHPYANRWGWQYLARYIISCSLNRRLRSDEHVHHIDLDKTNDDPSNLQLMIAEYHGRLHGMATVLARYRDDLGRFVESTDTLNNSPMKWPRHKAILGTEAECGEF